MHVCELSILREISRVSPTRRQTRTQNPHQSFREIGRPAPRVYCINETSCRVKSHRLAPNPGCTVRASRVLSVSRRPQVQTLSCLSYGVICRGLVHENGPKFLLVIRWMTLRRHHVSQMITHYQLSLEKKTKGKRYSAPVLHISGISQVLPDIPGNY